MNAMADAAAGDNRVWELHFGAAYSILTLFCSLLNAIFPTSTSWSRVSEVYKVRQLGLHMSSFFPSLILTFEHRLLISFQHPTS